MRKLLLSATALAAFAAPAQAATIIVDAAANSSTGGVGAFAGNFDLGNLFSVSVATTDLWRAGDLPRWSNANGIGGPDLIATGMDESMEAMGTVIGSNIFGQHTQGGLTANFGTLVGLMGTEYRVLGTSFSGAAWASGPLSLFYWDSNSADNSQFVTATVTAVPEPATWAMMILGFGIAGAALRNRKPAVSVRFA